MSSSGLLKTFYSRMASDERRRLLHFSISTAIFFVCYALIYSIEETPPSTRQEIAAALFIATGALAFGYAILLQLIFIISRLAKKPE